VFSSRETDGIAGMRTLVTCAECDTPLAGVDTVDERATIETDIENCSEHSEAAYVITLERL